MTMGMFSDGGKLLRANLNFLMKQEGLNSATLATATGVPQPTIHRILSGRSKDPKTNTLAPIAHRFGTTSSALRFVDIETAETAGDGRVVWRIKDGARDVEAEGQVLLDLLTHTTDQFVQHAKDRQAKDQQAKEQQLLDSQTLASLLDRLKNEIAELPAPLQKATNDLVLQYLNTPDAETGKQVADAITRIVNKPT